MSAELPGAEIAVVGAGAVGCSVAWRLAQAGHSVVVVEKTRPGAETSSAAGGILAAQIEGEEDGPLFRFLQRSERAYAEFAAELREACGQEPGYRRCGAFRLALDEVEAELLARAHAWQRAAGLAVERLDGSAVREREPALSSEIQAALWFEDAGQVDAQRLVPALWSACQKAGCRLVIGEARRILAESGRVAGVDVDGRRLAASAVVIAAGSWSALIEGSGLPVASVRPVRGQMVRFDLAPPVRSIVFGAHGYLVPRVDGHLLVGSTMEEVGFDKSVTDAGIRRLLALSERLCPELGRRPVGALWAGLRPACGDGLPALGPLPGIGGLHLATGHLRNGILLAPATAEVLAASVQGRPYELPAELRAARLAP